MHLLRVEDGGSLYDSDEAVDLGQPPGDIVVLTSADTEVSLLSAAVETRNAEAFQQQIAAIASEFGVLRAKGRVDVTGKALPFVVQAVGRRVDGYFARDRDSVSGRLVVIGMNGLDVAAIAARLGGELIDGHASS